MSRLVVLILIAALLIGGLFFLSTLPREQPTKTIEVAVPQPDAAPVNAH